ncbi:C2H2-type zinc finger protein [Candidatus Bathyarchaeota archaeon]|nr:C2H2-type zinc finger protein [Candidatus Bathyarchaeota archaeon]
MRVYHPELGEGLARFERLDRRVAQGKFECRICGETFTRKVNLQGHERSHFGDRPYACSACGRAFARVNDRKRHEKTHAKRGRGG